MKGSVVYHLGDKTLELKEKDSLFFDGRIAHVPKNKTKEEVFLLVMYFLKIE